MSKNKTHKQKLTEMGHRSGLEDKVAEFFKEQGIKAEYETVKVSFIQPEKKRTYTPDFVLPGNILIETKGRFTTADRMKHLYIKKSRPELDIWFLFQNPSAKLNKTSKTTYGAWCDKHGFKWAKHPMPASWLKDIREAIKQDKDK